MSAAIDALVAELAATWPHELQAHVILREMTQQIERGGTASLPYFRGPTGEVFWISLGGALTDLQRYHEDLTCWLIPYYGTEDSLTFVQSATGRLAHLISGVSACGYLRWSTPRTHVHEVLRTLGSMHRYLASAPTVSPGQALPLSTLQLQFAMALRIGEWDAAASIIEQIDQRQLDQAHRTMQMRIRLLDTRGAVDELFSFVIEHEAWNFPNPRRIAGAILRAVDASVIAPLHATDRYQDALTLMRTEWYPKLAHCLNQARDEQNIDNLRAYAALIDRDQPAAMTWAAQVPRPFSTFIEAQFTEAHPSTSRTQGDPPEAIDRSRDGDTFWLSLQTAIRQGQQERAQSLAEEIDSHLLVDARFIAAAPSGLLEILADEHIEVDTTARILRQQVVSSVIEATLSTDGFPKLAHIEIYRALADGLIYLRGASANDADSQLVLGLVSAIVYLEPKRVAECDEIIRGWWKQRAVIARLPWLVSALDAVAPLHPNPTALHDLMSDGLNLALRKRYVLTPMELKAWQRIGAALEMPHGDLEALLIGVTSPASAAAADGLASAGLKRIAIVSLHESGAREAAKELEERTGAEVVLVTSLVQDATTKKAVTADLILFVWAATSHAVYRAFDEHRAKLTYVQGTGAASIVTAAEKWARDKVSRAVP